MVKTNTKNGFSLAGVIIIIIVTSIISALATGVIVTNNYKNIEISDYKLSEDEDLQEFVDLYKTILSKYYDDIDKSKMLKTAENAMIEFLGDKYTQLLSDSEYKSLMSSLKDDYEGIGVTIKNNTIIKVAENSPAKSAGLLEGDVIVSINNTNVENLTNTEIGDLIKKSNKTVSLIVKRNDTMQNFTVKKSSIEYPYAEGNIIDNTSIAYLSISAFSESLSDQVSKELIELEKSPINGLIIDLRNNSGGYLNSATDTSSLFLKKGEPIYSLSSTNGDTKVIDKTEEHREYPIVVLVNKQTASAAEILAGALKHSYGATLVGNVTYGKGKVQQISSLKTGETIKYTTAKWLMPNGVCIDGAGIPVDYQVDLEYTRDAEGNIISVVDTQLNKAIELLS